MTNHNEAEKAVKSRINGTMRVSAESKVNLVAGSIAKAIRDADGALAFDVSAVGGHATNVALKALKEAREMLSGYRPRETLVFSADPQDYTDHHGALRTRTTYRLSWAKKED